MCLRADGNVETCRTDLTVYKVLTAENRSAYRLFFYSPNVLIRLRKSIRPNGFGNVHVGFHAYRRLPAAMDCLAHLLDTNYNGGRYKIVKMVIPKGAKMVYGRDGDIVSTSLRTGSLQALTTFEREQALTFVP